MKNVLIQAGRTLKVGSLGLWSLIKNNIDARDVHVYAGIVLLAVGCHMIYQPAGYIVAGITLLFIALRR